MATLTKAVPIRCLAYLGLAFAFSGCAEVRTLISVLFNGANSLSTSAFEFDEIRSGSKVTCTILGDKTVRCVGTGVQGNLGTYDAGPVEMPGEVAQIASGNEFTCMIAGPSNAALCFGRNDRGQLGNPNVGNSVKPVPVLDSEAKNAPLQDVKMITAGDKHACAILKSGRAVCWGDNSAGQLGNPDVRSNSVHSVLEGEKSEKPMTGVHAISAGGNSTCLIAHEDGTVYCFGERYGVTKAVNWSPDRLDVVNGIGSLAGAKEIGVGRAFGCALVKNSQVYCWGKNDFNQLGALSNAPGLTKATLVQVTYPQEGPINHIESISVGTQHACAIQRDEKTVYCWGDNRFGQLGNTSVRGNAEQVALGSNNLTLKAVKSVSLGPDRTCIISTHDELYCWGDGAHGLLGNDRVVSQYPVRVLDATGEILGNANSLSVGTAHACIVDLTHKAYCFGINEYGELGFNGFSGNAIQADQKPLTKISGMDTYGNRTCVIQGAEQSVACFGGRDIDVTNKKPEHNSFIAEELKKGVMPYKSIVGVALGHEHVCVIEANQGVTCTANNESGVPGNPIVVTDTTEHPLKDIWQVRSREDFNCALTQESGGIWCWGQWKQDKWVNAHLLPTRGKNTAEYIQFAMSDDQICGIRGVERYVYCTHFDDISADHFELEALSFSDGQPLRGMLMISAGNHHFCATNEDGHLVCWGRNDVGQLGFKSPSDYQRPTRISFRVDALKKVTRVTAGDRYTCVAGSDTPSLFCFGENFFGGTNSSEPVEYPL